jgi:hypothetical protein
MEKVVREGKVAVLYSPGFGAGWTTWGAPKELLFDPEVVALVEADQRYKIEGVLEARGFDFYMGGAGILAQLVRNKIERESDTLGQETVQAVRNMNDQQLAQLIQSYERDKR